MNGLTNRRNYFLAYYSIFSSYLVVVCLALVCISKMHAQPNSCKPTLVTQHQRISCFEKAKLSHVAASPSVIAPCGAVSSLSFEDTYYELSPDARGFSGYFEASRWQKNNGDGGVDVTGAPNSISVEGADIAQVAVVPGYAVILEVIVPAEGYATFDWKNIGGSNLLMKVNEQTRLLGSKGTYRSPLLQIGDKLTFQFDNTSQQEAAVKISRFRFLTNAVAVVERVWTASDNAGNTSSSTQLITIERPSVSNIVFPEHIDNNLNPVFPSGDPKEPFFSGFPMMDIDGNPETLHDQYPLSEQDCFFKVSWEDRSSQENGVPVLVRHWTVTDLLGGNILEYAQTIVPGVSMPLVPHTPETSAIKGTTALQRSVSNADLVGIGHQNDIYH